MRNIGLANVGFNGSGKQQYNHLHIITMMAGPIPGTLDGDSE